MQTDTLSLVFSAAALAAALAAWWRAGGESDVRELREQLRGKLEQLRRRQNEMAEHAAAVLTQAYEAHRRRIEAVRRRLREEAREAGAEIEEQMERARRQLDAVGERLERAARSVRGEAVSKAHAAEQAIARSVRRIEARVMLIGVRVRAQAARGAAERGDFDEAEALLARAADEFQEARALLGNDAELELPLGAIRASLREATSALKARAEDARQKIEKAIVDTEQLVGRLEADESNPNNH